MSNFPFPWWDKTITIYNRYVNPTNQRVSWYRTVVKECFWKCTNTVYVSGNNAAFNTKAIICRIPKNKRFVDKQAWKALDDKTTRFTLGNGDIIILGEVNDVIDEYVAGLHSTDLLTKYKEFDACLQVDTYVIDDYTGVGLEHYKVIGI